MERRLRSGKGFGLHSTRQSNGDKGTLLRDITNWSAGNVKSPNGSEVSKRSKTSRKSVSGYEANDSEASISVEKVARQDSTSSQRCVTCPPHQESEIEYL
jgi:hypothetical protein